MAVFILPRVKQECCGDGNKSSNVGSFIILWSGESLTSFNNDNSANFPGEKKYNEAFRGVYFNIKSNLVIVVVLFLKSKVLQWYHVRQRVAQTLELESAISGYFIGYSKPIVNSYFPFPFIPMLSVKNETIIVKNECNHYWFYFYVSTNQDLAQASLRRKECGSFYCLALFWSSHNALLRKNSLARPQVGFTHIGQRRGSWREQLTPESKWDFTTSAIA